MISFGDVLSGKEGGPKCFRCKRVAIKLIPLHNDGSGTRMCRDCKKQDKLKLKQKLQGSDSFRAVLAEISESTA